MTEVQQVHTSSHVGEGIERPAPSVALTHGGAKLPDPVVAVCGTNVPAVSAGSHTTQPSSDDARVVQVNADLKEPQRAQSGTESCSSNQLVPKGAKKVFSRVMQNGRILVAVLVRGVAQTLDLAWKDYHEAFGLNDPDPAECKKERQSEKVANCGGNQPSTADRLKAKHHVGYRTFKETQVAKAVNEDSVKQEAKAAADEALEKEKAEQEEAQRAENDYHDFTMDYQPFVSRSGGCAAPFTPIFGSPRSMRELLPMVWTFLIFIKDLFTRGARMPLYLPYHTVNGNTVFREHNHDDDVFYVPKFKGLIKGFGIAVLLACLAGLSTAVVWAFSFGSMGTLLQFFQMAIEARLVLYFFSMLFRPEARYLTGDEIAEFSQPRRLEVEPGHRDEDRMPGMRYRPAKDVPRFMRVDVEARRVRVEGLWWEKFWGTSWIFGSLQSWIQLNRLSSFALETTSLVVSMRAVAVLTSHLSGQVFDSLSDVQGKMQAFLRTYDELRAGPGRVDGRNWMDDTIFYASRLFWSQAAHNPRLGNQGSPHSD